MCTAISYINRSGLKEVRDRGRFHPAGMEGDAEAEGKAVHYFGRNLDLEYHYEERVTITPRNYSFVFRECGQLDRHLAMIGMAYVVEGYPLYYDATNEKGLSMAGLMFGGNAYYGEVLEGKDNIAPFELIPWVLGQCATVAESVSLLEKLHLAEIHFSEKLPLTPLHWMLADKEQCVVVEALKEGLKVYDNPVRVLTNNPPFPYQLMNLHQYRSLSRRDKGDTFGESLELAKYSRGMGAFGLPGDLSSMSRFVRAAFHRDNSVCFHGERENVNQFFHLLGSVEMPKGSLELEEGVYAYTVYSSCCNTDRGIYYYRTYESGEIVAVDLWSADLEGEKVETG